jgi:hypothetical protein
MSALRKCALALSALFLIAVLTAVLDVPEAAAQQTPPPPKPHYQKSLAPPVGCVQVPAECKCVVREGACCVRAGNCSRR